MNLRSLIPFPGNGNLARSEAGLFGSLHREVDRLFDEFSRGFGKRQGDRDYRGNARPRAQTRRGLPRGQRPNHPRREEARGGEQGREQEKPSSDREQLRRVLSNPGAAAWRRPLYSAGDDVKGRVEDHNCQACPCREQEDRGERRRANPRPLADAAGLPPQVTASPNDTRATDTTGQRRKPRW
jgi:hypothetical protein